MITRIPTTTTPITTTHILAIATPTCSHKSKSRAMQLQKQPTNNTTIITQQQLPASQPNANANAPPMRCAIRAIITTTMRRFSLALMQILLLSCALPPPLQLSPQRSLAVEALPITSKPIESTAENLAWQAWLKLPAEQKLLEKSRKVTPKSIFSLPFRECPPGHQLFQSRCIPTVNINQSDLLTQQVLGLFLGSAQDGSGGAGNADNAYEFDYGEEEYGLGLGEGESVVMYDAPQPYNGGGGGGGGGASTVNTPQQAPHMRDEPLKFNLFEQKYPTNDYESDVSSGSGGVEGSGRPMTDFMLGGGVGTVDSARRPAAVEGNGAESATQFFNSTQFLDAVQGFMHVQFALNQTMSIPNVNASSTTAERNRTTHGIQGNNQQHEPQQGLSDLHAASSNISSFAVDDIDAIVLPAVSSISGSTTAHALVGAGAEAESVLVASSGDLEPQHIALFKDNASVQLQVTTTVIAQTEKSNHTALENVASTGVEDTAPKQDEVEDLVAAAAQQQPQQSSLAQFLREDSLLPLSSSVGPYIITTATFSALETTTPSMETTTPNEESTTPPTLHTKDEHPRSVLEQNSAADEQSDTDAQEMRFITSTEAEESTTNFQIDETTVVEANEAEFEASSLLAAISEHQQQLESEKTKVEQVEEGSVEATTKIGTTTARITNTDITTITETTRVKTNGNTSTETKINADPSDEVGKQDSTTIVPISFEVYDEIAADETTTLQPLLSTADTTPTPLITTTKTTPTVKIISTTTPSFPDRFHSAPAAISATKSLLAHKQVSAAVSPAIVASSTTAEAADDGKAAASTKAEEFTGEFALNNMPGSGSNDLVNVAGNVDGNNDNNKKNNNNKSNKRQPIRIVVKKSALVGPKTSIINIEQELRMINELVKGNRQLGALKMPAIKTTTEIAETTTSTPEKLLTAAHTKLETKKKSANWTENEDVVSDGGDVEGVEVEVPRDVAEPKITTTTTEVVTAPMTTKEITTPRTTQVETTKTPQVVKTTLKGTSAHETIKSASNIEEVHKTMEEAAIQITTKSQASAKMESGISELAKAEATTTVKTSKKVAETARKIIELATKTSATEPDYEYETEATTKINTEADEATLWSRIMPLFGFGGDEVAVVEDEVVGDGEASAATTHEQTESNSSLGSSISSKSSSKNSSSSSNMSSSSKDSSINANDNNNNNNKNIAIKLTNNIADSLIRQNSKKIRIDHMSDNSVATEVAAAATTTNTLEEATATGTAIKAALATNTAETTATTHDYNANTEVIDVEEPSTYWWLPAGWRLDRGISEDQPLLHRLWSAFPESHLKTKVKT